MNNFCVPELYTLKFFTQKETYGYANICASHISKFSFREEFAVFTFSNLCQLPM